MHPTKFIVLACGKTPHARWTISAEISAWMLLLDLSWAASTTRMKLINLKKYLMSSKSLICSSMTFVVKFNKLVTRSTIQLRKKRKLWLRKRNPKVDLCRCQLHPIFIKSRKKQSTDMIFMGFEHTNLAIIMSNRF